ncbi:MAG: glycoside hydrolase family 47 protein [Bacteroidetes bacterium]|nr:glycoside hydrolase family 47 protein [Bacteroidota bacterium]
MKELFKKFLLLWCMLMIFSVSAKNPPDKKFETDKAAMAERVKAAFLKGWLAYKTYAWGMDAVKPLSGKGQNWYDESLLMTPVDAFSTMCIMGLGKEKEEAKKLIFGKLDFNKDFEVQQFEITIRMLGGLLSSYQLDGDKRFLELAIDLGNRLLPVFNSPTGMPYKMINLKTGKVSGKISNPAEIGTMLLEYGMLSRLTGNTVYYEKSKKAVVELYKLRGKTGLPGTQINVETGEWTDRQTHISGMIDSYYEYLLKGWLLFGDRDLKQMWEASRDGINKYLADDVKTGFWYGGADMDSGIRTSTEFGALDCFFGAVLCLDGDFVRAAKLEKSIQKMWDLYGLEPESIDYITMQVTSPSYIVRPEAIETTYYLWHFTKDPKYYEAGKHMFESIEKYCQADNGYVEIKDVRTMEKLDALQSFFFAETMKYCYLFFAPDDAFNLDKVVLNTEAHPFFREKK